MTPREVEGPVLEPLERIEPPSRADFVARYVAEQEPVCIRGALERWPALGRWSPRDFEARFGDRFVEAYVMREGRIVLDPKTGFLVERLTVRDYVRACLDEAHGPRLYLRSRLPDVLPELVSEIETPAYCEDGLLLRRNLWFSAKGTITELHFDLPHNLIAEVHGRKRFLLFPFRERPRIYACSPFSSTPHLARVDPEHPDLTRFPRLGEARGYEVTLEPGDLLYMPPRLYHYARSVEASISVNFWWSDRRIYPFVRLSDAYKKLRGLNI
jgi:hypothetical protein